MHVTAGNHPLSLNEAACAAGVPLKAVRRIIDSGLLQGAVKKRKGRRTIQATAIRPPIWPRHTRRFPKSMSTPHASTPGPTPGAILRTAAPHGAGRSRALQFEFPSINCLGFREVSHQ